MRGQHADAELAKLAHQLGVPVARLGVVAGLPAADLRALRGQISDALFHADRHHFTRLAALAKAVPPPVAARMTELALPPLLAARTAELFDPDRAADLVTRLPGGYLADVAAAMDPGRSPEVVAAIPADRVALVAAELAGRGEWVVMGAFVSFVSEPALRAAIAVLDGGQLLRIGFVLDDANRLDDIGELLSQRQLDQLLAAAAADGLWRELGELLGDLADEPTARLAARYAEADEAVHAAVAGAAERGELSAESFARLG